MNEVELKSILPIHPYMANKRIKEIVPEESILVVEDTFEDVLWNEDERKTIKDRRQSRPTRRKKS